MRLDVLTGAEAALYVPVVWPQIPERVRRYVLWDLPYDRREASLSEAWGKSLFVGMAWDGDNLAAASWVERCNAVSDAVLVHFFTCGGVPISVCEDFLALIKRLGFWDSAYAVVPVSFRHVRNFAARLGFREIAHVQNLIYGYPKGAMKAVLLQKRLN